jgi:aconitate hydratase
MLALTFANPDDYNLIRQDDVVSIVDFEDMKPGVPMKIKLDHADGTSNTIEANHTYNAAQIGWVRSGSALNEIREKLS